MEKNSIILKKCFKISCILTLLTWFCFILPTVFSEEGSSQPLFPDQKTLLVIDSEDSDPYISARESTIRHLTFIGYMEGRNLSVKYYSIGNNKEKGKEILKEELKNNYDAILLNGTIITIAAKEVAFNKEPYNFIFICVTDPIGLGIIKDFGKTPDYNFTGVSYPVPVQSRIKFIKEIIPSVKRVGLIYADIPQSHSYRKWIETALKEDDDLKDIEVICRKVPFIPGKEGENVIKDQIKKYVLELESEVDIFMTPNDQMGIKKYFAEIVYLNSKKPLVGLIREDVMEGWGATICIYPSHNAMGIQAAKMIKKIFEGEALKKINPETSKENGFAFDLKKAREFGIVVPIQYLNLAGDNIVK